MGMLAVALPLVGGIVSGIGASENANYQAQVAQNNAITAQRQAALSAEMGDAKAAQSGMKTAQTVGKAKAALGAAGVETNSGSAADVTSGIEAAGLTDAQTIRSDAARQTWGYQVQQSNDLAQSQLDKQTGQFGEMSSFLGGASSAAGNYAKLGSGSNPFAGLASIFGG